MSLLLSLFAKLCERVVCPFSASSPSVHSNSLLSGLCCATQLRLFSVRHRLAPIEILTFLPSRLHTFKSS